MKNFKVMSIASWLLAVLLSNVMCATVAYNYSYMLCAIKYEGFSAPANVAFTLAIPYLIGIAICVGFAVFFKRKSNKMVDK